MRMMLNKRWGRCPWGTLLCRDLGVALPAWASTQTSQGSRLSSSYPESFPKPVGCGKLSCGYLAVGGLGWVPPGEGPLAITAAQQICRSPVSGSIPCRQRVDVRTTQGNNQQKPEGARESRPTHHTKCRLGCHLGSPPGAGAMVM